MSDLIARLEAALAGRYKIDRKLGEGGMATVYLAEDVKHERRVAIKILRSELAAVIGAGRFLAEIKTTANLQHPHILPLFDSGEADGFLFYVMPFIDGDTLRDRIEREGQLGVEESVRIARDVADALDYAHRNDIIHRDIKPANILLHDGRPVVADFGIALAVSAAGGGRMTETGLSLGTPHYMSPEQASADRDLSARSDVYSLGCVLYEMLAGQPPHTGPSAQSILVRILTEDPRPISEVRRSVPAHVAAAVTKAIEKLPADRFDTARQFIDALGDESFTYAAQPATRATAGAAATPAPPGRSPALLAATGVLAVTTAVFGWMALGQPRGALEAPAAVTAFQLTEESHQQATPIVSPDGSVVIFRDGMLHLRRAGTLDFVPLDGTEGATGRGAFSPDGAWLAFGVVEGDRGALRRMPAAGGPVTTLWTPTEAGTGPRWVPGWGEDGHIYLDLRGVLGRLPEAGGAADTLLVLEQGRITRVTVLPGAQGLLFTLAGVAQAALNRVVLMDLATRDTSTLIPDGFDAQWVASGHVVYAHQGGALYALPFDAGRLEATGPAVPVVDDAATVANLWGRFAVTPQGMLVYARGAPEGRSGVAGIVFALVDTAGARQELPLSPTDHADAHLSPDGRTLAYIREDHVRVYDLELGTNLAVTEEGGAHHNPVWSPDGRELVFASNRGDGRVGLWARAVDGSAPARFVGTSGMREGPYQWLDDGTILIGTEVPRRDIYAIEASGGAEARALLQADWSEFSPSVSPDGRWLAFASDEEGVPEVHLRRWPDLVGKVRVVADRPVSWASQIVWGEDSRRLWFADVDGELWQATIRGADEEPIVEARALGVSAFGLWGRHPDGRLLVEAEARAARADSVAGAPRGVDAPYVVVNNWLTALRARVGEGGE